METKDDDRTTAIGKIIVDGDQEETDAICPYCGTENIYSGNVIGEDVCCDEKIVGCLRTFTVVGEINYVIPKT